MIVFVHTKLRLFLSPYQYSLVCTTTFSDSDVITKFAKLVPANNSNSKVLRRSTRYSAFITSGAYRSTFCTRFFTLVLHCSHVLSYPSSFMERATFWYVVLFLTTPSRAFCISSSPHIAINALVSSEVQPAAISSVRRKARDHKTRPRWRTFKAVAIHLKPHMKVDWDEYALNLDLIRFENLRIVRTKPNRIECGFNAH